MIQELMKRLAAAKENGRLQAVWSARLADLEQNGVNQKIILSFGKNSSSKKKEM